MDVADCILDNSTAPSEKSGDGHLHRDQNDNTLRNNVTAATFGYSDVELEGHRNDVASPMYRRELHTIHMAPEQEDLSQDFKQFKLPSTVNSDRLLADVRNGAWPTSQPGCPVAVGDQASRYLRAVDTKNLKTAFARNSIRSNKKGLTPTFQEFTDHGGEPLVGAMKPQCMHTSNTQPVNTAILSNAASVTPLDILSSVACAEHRRLASSGPNIQHSSSQASQSDSSGNFVNEQVPCSRTVSSNNVSTTSVPICSTSSPPPVCQPISNSNMLPTGHFGSVNTNQRPVCIQESKLVPRKPPLYSSPALPPVCVDATGISVMQRVDHSSISMVKTQIPGEPPFHCSFVALPTAMTLPITTSAAANRLTPVNPSGIKEENHRLNNTWNNGMSHPEWRPSIGKTSFHRKRRKQKSNHHASSPEATQLPPHSISYKPRNHIPQEVLQRKDVGAFQVSRTFLQSLPCPGVPASSVQKTFIPPLHEFAIPKSTMMMISQHPLPFNQLPLQPVSRNRAVYESFAVNPREPNLVPKKSPASIQLAENASPVTNGKYFKKQMKTEAEEFSEGKVYSKDKPEKSESTVNSFSSSADIVAGLRVEPKQVTLVTGSISTTVSDLNATSVLNPAYIKKHVRGNSSLTSEGCATIPAPKSSAPNGSSIATHTNTMCKHNEPHVPTSNKDHVCGTNEGSDVKRPSEPTPIKHTVSSQPETLINMLSGGLRNLPDHCANTKVRSESGETHHSRRKRVAEEDSNCKLSKRRRPNDAVIVCNLCQHTVNYNLEWKRHIKEKHWDLVKRFSCKECFIPFESKAEFLQHLAEEHPKMLPFRLLPEKVFCTMIEEHKQFKRKSKCNESNQPKDSDIPNAADRIAGDEPPPPAKVCSQPVSLPNHTGSDTGSVTATNVSEEKMQQIDEISPSEQPAETTELHCSTQSAEISCSTETDDNTAELAARRMSKDEGYTTDTVSRDDSGNDWQNDNDNASTKSYAESPDRNISDSEIPPTPTSEEPQVEEDDCQLLYCHYSDDHQSGSTQSANTAQQPRVTGPCSPTGTKLETAVDVSKKEDGQLITDAPKADQSEHQEQVNTQTTKLLKTFIEVGNSRRKLNIRPGLLDARLYKRKFKSQRKNVSRHGFRFRRPNSIRKRKRKSKVGFLCDDLDDATLPDLDLPGKEIKTDTDIQSDLILSCTSVCESSSPSPDSDNQVCSSNQYRSERGIDSDEETAGELTEEKDESKLMRRGADIGDECHPADTESSVVQSKRQSESVFERSRSYSETTPPSVQLVLTERRRCFVKLERKFIIDSLKGGTLRIGDDGRLLDIKDTDYHDQPPFCKRPEAEELSEESDARLSTFTQGSTQNQTSLVTNYETDQFQEPDFSCDQGYGSNNWSCMLCTYSSNAYESLRQHVQKEHLVYKRYFCPKCSVNSDEYSTVEDHILYVHKDVTAVVLSRRCTQEQELIDALCLWLPRELKWKNIKLKLERAAKMSTFVRSKLNFNDSKRYTCYVCNKQIKSLVLIRKHVAAYWKLANNTGNANAEVLTDSDVLKELFDRRYRVIPRRRSSSLRDTCTERYRMEQSVQGIPDKHSNGKFRKLTKSKHQPSHKKFTNVLYTRSVDSSDSSLCDSIVDTSDRPVRKPVEEGRSIWTTFGKMSSDLPGNVSADSLNPSYFTSTSHKDCAAGGTKEGLSLRLVRTSSSCQFDGHWNHTSGVANNTNSTSENKHTSPVLSSSFANQRTEPASDVEGGDQLNSLKNGGLYSDCSRLVKPDTKLNMKPTVLLQAVSRYTQKEQV